VSGGKTAAGDQTDRSSHRSFETHRQELLCLNGEFHRELLENILAEAVDDIARRFGGQAITRAVLIPPKC
jgi:hypothetical protein